MIQLEWIFQSKEGQKSLDFVKDLLSGNVTLISV